MKFFLTLTIFLSLFTAKATKDQAPVLETKHFRFYNNVNLNTHLFLYKKAVRCKVKKTPKDSIAFVGSENASMPLDEKEMELVKKTILYYRDSIVGKDLLFAPEMNAFSDMLVKDSPEKEKMNAWQKKTWKKIDAFKILYLKIYSKQFNRDCADWILYCKKDITGFEDSVMKKLQKIYGDTLPDEKIRVDLTNYATWAGAYSYKNAYMHIVLDAGNKNNKKEAGVEVLFHEASHFMVDHVAASLEVLLKDKKVSKNLNLWHNLIFYTTAVVLDPLYKAEKRTFTPYYVSQGFEQKFPDFKRSVDAFKLYWEPYLAGKSTQKEALEKIVAELTKN